MYVVKFLTLFQYAYSNFIVYQATTSTELRRWRRWLHGLSSRHVLVLCTRRYVASLPSDLVANLTQRLCRSMRVLVLRIIFTHARRGRLDGFDIHSTLDGHGLELTTGHGLSASDYGFSSPEHVSLSSTIFVSKWLYYASLNSHEDKQLIILFKNYTVSNR